MYKNGPGEDGINIKMPSREILREGKRIETVDDTPLYGIYGSVQLIREFRIVTSW